MNRVVKAIKSLPVDDIKILVGNHDWLKSGQEFFRFLSVLPNVQYINTPTEDSDVKEGAPSVYYLPYSKNPAKDWAGFDLSHYDFVFMHQTIKGAIASNGQEMDGEELPDLTQPGKVYSGDIHVPQKIGPVEYVGSPYHVHFGDSFKPRAVLLEHGGRPVDLHFKTLSRLSLKVRSLKQLTDHEFRRGDHLKLTFELPESEAHDWKRIKRLALEYLKEQEVEVYGLKLTVTKGARRLVAPSNNRTRMYSPSQAIERFVGAEELGGEILDAALTILED